MENKEQLLATVKTHMEYAAAQSGRVHMFAALYGSQNYGIATPESDVDTKVWLMPRLRDLALAEKPYSKELHYEGAHVEGKDYRLMLGELRKQNMNFLETIFTPYKVVNPNYQWVYDTLYVNREAIARMNVSRGAHAFMGHMYNMYNRFKRDENPKQVAHLMRLYDCLQRYALTEEPYEDLLFKPNNRDYLMAVRRGEVPMEELHDMAETYMGLANNVLENLPENNVSTYTYAEGVLVYVAEDALLNKFGV